MFKASDNSNPQILIQEGNLSHVCYINHKKVGFFTLIQILNLVISVFLRRST